jgi:biofilm PGA synthesis N-glycosyltransferase PgaC
VIVALVPAHNEEALLPGAIDSLRRQTVAIDRIVVVSDNSSDRTPAIAREWGGAVELFETRHNVDKKSGALNQALLTLNLPDEAIILVMDADSGIVPGFVETALGRLADPTVGAVGGIFLAEEAISVLGRLQANEYIRYGREIGRDDARVRVLTGTATVARMGTLRQVAHARGAGLVPGVGVYRQDALTEDFELTLAIKHLGYTTVSPKECQVLTEVMEDIPSLWRQRLRWQQGAVQTLATYGITRITRSYILKQAEMALVIVAILALWTLLSAARTATRLVPRRES